MNIAVVCPSNRPERLAEWRAAWAWPDNVNLIVVEDTPETWAKVSADLGADAWIIPRRTDCIRSYGFLLAARAGAEVVVTLDDDCLPIGEFSVVDPAYYLKEHDAGLADHEAMRLRWAETIGGYALRGFPKGPTFILKETQRTIVNHGLWAGVLDFDAAATLSGAIGDSLERAYRGAIPVRHYFPMSGMNLAFRREALPCMYFGLQGSRHFSIASPVNEMFKEMQREDPSVKVAGDHALMPWPFDRFGDIWCGIIMKRIADHLGYAVRSGLPFVRHERASDPFVNLVKEAPGIAANEHFWRAVDAVTLTGTTIAECYVQVAEQFPALMDGMHPKGDYWKTLGEAMKVWARLTSGVLSSS